MIFNIFGEFRFFRFLSSLSSFCHSSFVIVIFQSLSLFANNASPSAAGVPTSASTITLQLFRERICSVKAEERCFMTRSAALDAIFVNYFHDAKKPNPRKRTAKAGSGSAKSVCRRKYQRWASGLYPLFCLMTRSAALDTIFINYFHHAKKPHSRKQRKLGAAPQKALAEGNISDGPAACTLFSVS
jgi:hypothetical protein